MFEVPVLIVMKFNDGETKRLVDNLKTLPRAAEKTLARAINKSMTTTRAHMVKLVRQDYDVKAGAVRNVLAIKKANWSNPEGRIHGAGSPGVPLFGFVRGGTRAPSTKRLKRGGYRPKVGKPVRIRKNKGVMTAKGLFLARMDSGHVGAFKRDGKKRLGITERYGPSPMYMLAAPRYDGVIEDFADKTLKKNLFHEAEHVLRQMGLK